VRAVLPLPPGTEPESKPAEPTRNLSSHANPFDPGAAHRGPREGECFSDDSLVPDSHHLRCRADPISVATADVNRDGKLDLVVADEQAGVAVLLNNGSGGFGPASH
jgi:hypothetical protein